MAQCIHNSTSDLNWQQQQQQQQQQQEQQQQEIEEQNNSSFAPISSFQLLQNGVKRHGHVHDQIEKLEFHGWPDFTATQYENFGAANVGEETISTRQASSSRSSKRKCETSPNLKSKRAKEGIAEEEENTSETQQSIESLKEKSKGCSRTSEMTVKADYIHVRARRGQATDRHSLAERVRRERISERMKYLQDLVPGCSKPTGKAGMLDEIINYVQSLQRQVEFLSMKLAVVNPRLDLTIDDFFSGEINATCNSGLFQGTNMLLEQLDPSYLQLKSLQQAQDGPCCGLELAMDTPDLVLHRTISTQVPVTHTFLDSCFNVHGCSSPWDYALELHQERESTLPCQSLQGDLLPGNPKMEM